MKLIMPDSETSQHHLQTLVELAHAGTGGFGQPQRAVLDALQKIPYETSIDLEATGPRPLSSLKAHTETTEEAQQLVRLMLVVALADGPPSAEQITVIESTARELGVHEPAVGVMRLLAEHRMLRFRISFMRRSHLRNYFANTYRLCDGAGAVAKGILMFRGVINDKALTARYRALGKLPSDTLGRQFHDHCIAAPIPFPGEKGGFPEGAVYHDFTHVLSSYDTSPEGEMKAAAFQAGYTQGNWDFFTWLFALVIHTAGINLAPFSYAQAPGSNWATESGAGGPARIGEGRSYP